MAEKVFHSSLNYSATLEVVYESKEGAITQHAGAWIKGTAWKRQHAGRDTRETRDEECALFT
jgi:hypothetical protein